MAHKDTDSFFMAASKIYKQNMKDKTLMNTTSSNNVQSIVNTKEKTLNV